MTVLEGAIYFDFEERYGFPQNYELTCQIAGLRADRFNYPPFGKVKEADRVSPGQIWRKADQSRKMIVNNLDKKAIQKLHRQKIMVD